MNSANGKHLAFPFRIGTDGRTVHASSLEDHVRDELTQLILTNPGERINLPTFGGGVRRLLFENINDTTAGMTKAQLTQAISHWLGQRISVAELSVFTENETIEVEIKYRLAGSEDLRTVRFQRREV